MGHSKIFAKENSLENHGEHMSRILFHLVVPAAISVCLVALALPTGIHAQSDVAKAYKKNCVLCHAADGSGNSSSGKALGAKDLASSEVQKQTDEELTEVIAKGKGKMPAFSAKLKPEDIAQLVAYIRAIAKK
jgi:cytochrome c6